MSRDRAWRRAQYERAKARALRMLKTWDFFPAAGSDKTPEQWVGFYANTRKPCSCWMCGNARESMGPTLQERRAGVPGTPDMTHHDWSPIHGWRERPR